MSPIKIANEIGSLWSLPDIIIRINELIDSPTTTAEDIGDVVANDPALTARLLKIVNSSFFGLVEPIESVSRAIVLIGTQELFNLILAATSAETFRSPEHDAIDIYHFWHRSVFTASVAKELVLCEGRCNLERYFVIGLLHDIGELALASQEPDLYSKALELSDAESIDHRYAEQRVFGFDSAAVAAELLRLWHFPQSLVEPIACQKQPGNAKEFRKEAAILNIAVALTDVYEPETSGHTIADPAPLYVASEAWEITGLTENDINSAQLLANIDCMEILEIICPRV